MKTSKRALVEAVHAYLPPSLIQDLASNPRQPPIFGKWLTGSLAHCDISGFTAMSESLAQRGKEGAEIMAAVLNRFFDTMLAVADRWGGQQVKFGGDAMLLLFTGADHAARAGVCALQMQHAMSQFRRVSVSAATYRLKMRVGIHSGRFFAASVGDPEKMLHYLLLGPDVSLSAVVEAAARSGEVLVTKETAELLGDSCRLASRDAGLFGLLRFHNPPPPAESVHRDGAPNARLQRYLLPSLRGALGTATPSSGEHRRVTCVFVNLLGIADLLAEDEETALGQTNLYVAGMIRLLAVHGGGLMGSDVADRGDKLIALFGAPVSQERQEENAVRFAVQLDEMLGESKLRLRHRIGINTGFAFAGEIGSAARREYTVIGDAVNLAARLMSAAGPGEIVVSSSTASQMGTAPFTLARMRPFRVKGKSQLVRAFRATRSLPPTASGAPEPDPMIGRRQELAALLSLARRAARGRAVWAHVYGDPGMGKSLLCQHLATQLKTSGWQVIVASGHSHTAQAPLAPWIALLRSMLPGGEVTLEAVSAMIKHAAPDRLTLAPLVAGMLSIGAQPDPGLSSLDPRTSRRLLQETLVEIIAGSSARSQVLLLVEDLHWFDGDSLELLLDLRRRRNARLLVCLTSRQPPFNSLPVDLPLHVAPLPAGDAAQILHSSASLPPDEISEIVSRAQGNPLFLREFALAGGARGDMPETVGDIMMARVDRLAPTHKSVMRVASVIGPTFETPVLHALVGRSVSRRTLGTALAELQRSGFVRHEGGPVHAFSHIIARDVVYESMLFSHRRRLHADLLRLLESGPDGRVPPDLLLHHAERAEDTRRVIRYATLAGDRAAGVFSGRSALDYYQRALHAASTWRRPLPGERSLILERIADAHETLGHHSEATDAYVAALDTWALNPARRRITLTGGHSVDRSREATLCRKIAVSLERRHERDGEHSAYDRAIEWLDRAMAVVPRGKPRLTAQICATRSISLFRKGLHEEGLEWGRRALSFARRSRDVKEVAYARNMLATCFMERGELARAIRQLRSAVRLYHEFGDFPGQASANNNLGMCYYLQGTLDGALYHYQVALTGDQRVGDDLDAAIVHGNIGEVLLALGRIDEAVESLSLVVRLHRETGGLAAVTGLAYVNLSRCRLAVGDAVTAARDLRRARRLLRQVGAQALLLEADLQHSELLMARGRPAASLQAARRALRRIRALNAQLLEVRAERLIGQALASLGRPTAETHLRAALALARRLGARHEEARSSLALGRYLAEDRGSPGRGATYLGRARTILRRMGAQLELREAERLLEATS